MLDETIAGYTRRLRDLSDPLFRIAVSLIFIIGRLGHFFRPDEMLARIGESPWAPVVALFGDPLLHLRWTGGVFVVAGLALAVGYSTRLAAILLFVALVPVTVVVHVVPDSSHVGPLFKNVAILGELFFLAVNGARCCALDVRKPARPA